MIWRSLSFNGTMELQVVQRRRMAAGYVELLQGVSLMTEDHHLFGNDWVFQQDTAVHKARLTKDSFQRLTSLLWTILCAPLIYIQLRTFGAR